MWSACIHFSVNVYFKAVNVVCVFIDCRLVYAGPVWFWRISRLGKRETERDTGVLFAERLCARYISPTICISTTYTFIVFVLALFKCHWGYTLFLIASAFSTSGQSFFPQSNCGNQVLKWYACMITQTQFWARGVSTTNPDNWCLCCVFQMQFH